MISSRRFLLACAGGLLLAPFAAAAQSDPQPEATPTGAETPAPKQETETPKDTASEEGQRVCRSVRADPSSRRKTRVCRTAEEWRNMNVPL